MAVIGVGVALIWRAGSERVEPDRRGRAFAARLSEIDAYVSDLERARRLRELGHGDLPEPAEAAAALADLGELLAGDVDGAAPVLGEVRATVAEMLALGESGFKSGLEWRERRAEYGALRERLIQRVRAIGAFDLSDVLPTEPTVEAPAEAVAAPVTEMPQEEVAEPVTQPAAEPAVEPVVEAVVELSRKGPAKPAAKSAAKPGGKGATQPAAKKSRRRQRSGSTRKSSKRKS